MIKLKHIHLVVEKIGDLGGYMVISAWMDPKQADQECAKQNKDGYDCGVIMKEIHE